MSRAHDEPQGVPKGVAWSGVPNGIALFSHKKLESRLPRRASTVTSREALMMKWLPGSKGSKTKSILAQGAIGAKLSMVATISPAALTSIMVTEVDSRLGLTIATPSKVRVG